MLTTKFAFAAALVTVLVFGVTLSAEARAAQSAQSTSDNVIPGYGKDGGRVAIPNPNR
ncbi:MAG: hypothetical protein WBQ24_21270 [Xanthobacteraceae bacterium]|jgi:hypothetical protein